MLNSLKRFEGLIIFAILGLSARAVIYCFGKLYVVAFLFFMLPKLLSIQFGLGFMPWTAIYYTGFGLIACFINRHYKKKWAIYWVLFGILILSNIVAVIFLQRSSGVPILRYIFSGKI